MSDNQHSLRVVHYINQFFGGIGGEDHAHIAPEVKDGAVGPGRLLEQSSGGNIKVTATVICGDNFFSEHPSALQNILGIIKEHQPNAVVTGPAFAAGRYGEACTAVAESVKEHLNIPVITGLAPDSPALERYRAKLDILKTESSAVDMKNSMPRMGKILVKRVREEKINEEEQEWLYTKGLKKNIVVDQTAAKRAVEMALAKHRNEQWKTEVPMVVHESVPPAKPINSEPFRLALITDGGLVSKGNPERMTSVRSKKWCKIDTSPWPELTENLVDINHNGYNTRHVKEDPNRLVPFDIARELQLTGKITLHPYIYSTAGVATAIENGERFGREIAEDLKREEAQAALLTST